MRHPGGWKRHVFQLSTQGPRAEGLLSLLFIGILLAALRRLGITITMMTMTMLLGRLLERRHCIDRKQRVQRLTHFGPVTASARAAYFERRKASGVQSACSGVSTMDARRGQRTRSQGR